jgi:hypothetical protein
MNCSSLCSTSFCSTPLIIDFSSGKPTLNLKLLSQYAHGYIVETSARFNVHIANHLYYLCIH